MGATYKTNTLTPFLKWAGGKEQELRYILPLLPPFEHYYEPFVGGGAVFFSLQAKKSFINDRSPELFMLYQMITQADHGFFCALDILLHDWQYLSDVVLTSEKELISLYQAYSDDLCSLIEIRNALLKFIQHNQPKFENMFCPIFTYDPHNFMYEIERNLFNKTKRMKRLEGRKWKLPQQDIIANIECACKSAFYMHVRYLYNNIKHYGIPANLAAALFFFIRENAYAAMFRYNRQGAFNVPYGGISYNRKNLASKVDYMRSSQLRAHLSQAVIENMDFEVFLRKYPPQANDFVFVDPPYDSEFSTYARNEFGLQDQERLAHYLVTECQAKFMLVIKNTPAIFSLYSQHGLNMRLFHKKYLVNFHDRNDKDVKHLIITNY